MHTTEIAARDLAEGHMIVITVADGTKFTDIIREVYTTEDMTVGLDLMTMGLTDRDPDQMVTVVTEL